MASWTQRKDELQTYARSLDKSVTLHTKTHWTHVVLKWAVLICTFSLGKTWLKSYLSNFGTTLGSMQFYPETFTYDQVKRLIPHETGHTKEFRMYGLWIHPLLGIPALAIKYGFLPLPVLLAFGRAHSELFAEKFAWKVKTAENITTPKDIRTKATYLANNVSGPMYLWSIPRKWCLNWYHSAAEKHIAQHYSAE